MIDLKDFETHLNGISINEWETLFALLPELRKGNEFEKEDGLENLEKEKLKSVSQVSDKTIRKIMDIIYSLNIIPVFDWKSWRFGIDILERKNFDYSTLDKITLCKLLTCIVRENRFDPGFLDSCFKDGKMEKILTNLKNDITS